MGARVQRINRELQWYDRELFASELAPGNVRIYRKARRWDCHAWGGAVLKISRVQPLLVLSLTDNWSMNGNPVEWGLEPIMDRLKEIDDWRNPRRHEELEKKEQRRDEIKKQSQRNELKATAYDLRREFAKATNDINTATVEKIDLRRRKENAYCK